MCYLSDFTHKKGEGKDEVLWFCPMSETQALRMCGICWDYRCKLSVLFLLSLFQPPFPLCLLSAQHFLLVLPRGQKFLHLFSLLFKHSPWPGFWIYMVSNCFLENCHSRVLAPAPPLALCSICLPDLVPKIGNGEGVLAFDIVGIKHTEKKWILKWYANREL